VTRDEGAEDRVERIPDKRANALELLDAQEQASDEFRLLEKWTEQLPLDLRRAAILIYRGHSYTDVARIMGKDPDTIRAMRKKMKRYLKEPT